MSYFGELLPSHSDYALRGKVIGSCMNAREAVIVAQGHLHDIHVNMG
jgi:hypothetical protein